MKKLVLTACALTCAVSVFAQGTVIFNNRVAGTTVSRVFGANATNPNLVQSGNSATDIPAGTTDWTGFTGLEGGGWSAQLWAAPTTAGVIAPEPSLLAALPITTFRTGAAAGFVNGVTATLTGVPADAPVATLQLRVWNNAGGTVNTWDAAQAGGQFAKSALFNVNAIGGLLNPAPAIVGLQSFNVPGGIIPEPSTFALAGLGAAALLIFRRRK